MAELNECLISGRKIAGFTLLELLVTVSIAAVVMAIAVPSFNSSIQSNRLTTNANQLVTAFNIARSEAIKRGQMLVIRPAAGANWEDGWRVFVDIDRSTTANTDAFNDNGNSTLCEKDSSGALTEDCVLREVPALQTGYTLRSNNFPVSATFTPAGRVQVGTVATTGIFVLCNNSDNNETAEANTSRLVILNALGQVRMGADSNGDAIPNLDTVATAASNQTDCTP